MLNPVNKKRSTKHYFHVTNTTDPPLYRPTVDYSDIPIWGEYSTASTAHASSPQCRDSGHTSLKPKIAMQNGRKKTCPKAATTTTVRQKK
jgi:hypothetical protein